MCRIVIEGIPYVLIREDEYLKGTGHVKEAASRAIESLTCLELDAAKALFDKIDTVTNVILSKIASELNIGKSAMTLMIKKLESNQIIEVASMGMKGTRITILNKEFKDMLAKL